MIFETTVKKLFLFSFKHLEISWIDFCLHFAIKPRRHITGEIVTALLRINVFILDLECFFC